MPTPDESTLEWTETILGPFRVESHFAHTHGSSSLWRLAVGSDHVWLKMHSKPHKWACEVHALTRWTDPLAPQALGWREQPEAVLLTECSGADAKLVVDGVAMERLWTQAGNWLKRFHVRTNDWIGNVGTDGAPNGHTTSDPMFHVTKTFESRLRQGRDTGLFSVDEIEFAERTFRASSTSLVGARAHSVHRDFHPRNWLAARDGTLTAVIDFEHARWDLRASDLSRPWDEEFRRHPRLVDAFYEGYGRPDQRFMSQIQTFRLYANVVSAVSAEEVGDVEYSRFNHEALRRLMTPT
jgi:hypothetical protein